MKNKREDKNDNLKGKDKKDFIVKGKHDFILNYYINIIGEYVEKLPILTKRIAFYNPFFISFTCKNLLNFYNIRLLLEIDFLLNKLDLFPHCFLE
jgi:hypothetical protein